MHTHTLHVENREAVNDRLSYSGRRWFVLRNQHGFADRMAAIIRYRDGWTVYGAIDLTVSTAADIRPDAITRLTFREANTIARLYVRTGTLYRSAPVRERAKPRVEKQLMLAFAVLPR